MPGMAVTVILSYFLCASTIVDAKNARIRIQGILLG